ncbi:ATPase family associated with various cellular activities (AAA) domain-containing protein [Ditylenchus destructor]|nr:ATPase family associated with various cellular activities (AAA) domain-containing protein [Ditylenchus destructor]
MDCHQDNHFTGNYAASPHLEASASPQHQQANHLEGNMGGAASFDFDNGSNWSRWISTFLSHPLLFGSIGVTFFGLLGYYLRWIYNIVQEAFYKYFVRSLVITNNNPEYEWVVAYIQKHSWWSTKNLSVNSTLEYDRNGIAFVEREFKQTIATGRNNSGDSNNSETHYFCYSRQFIQAHRFTESAQSRTTETERRRVVSRPVETLIFTTYRCQSDFWDKFLSDISTDEVKTVQKGLTVYTYDANFGSQPWRLCGRPRRKRSLDSVILDDGVMEKLADDLEDFLASEDWYHRLGVPYRRGYLLYGPPGTGKTSFVAAFASHFGMSVRVLSLTDDCLNDQQLHRALSCPSHRSITILEDIDVAFPKRGEKVEKEKEIDEWNDCEKKPSSTVTLSGLLNALDGMTSCERRIVFMTTNCKEKLDGALIRPGRVDCDQFFGHCTPKMITKMFNRFYEDASEQQCDQFLNSAVARETTISPAQLQRHFIRYKNNLQGAIDKIGEIH